MPSFVPPVPDERTALLAYLDKQREGLRNAVRGLDDEQLSKVPSASALSLGGLLKHVTRSERRWVQAGLGGLPLPGLWPIVEFESDFILAETDTAEFLLADYETCARETEAVLSDVTDLGAPCALPEAAHWSARWVLLHVIEETARHGGHADIIRESLDGRTAGTLDPS
ncbi:DinB family protein [Umezawaea sp. Da 62-37]|uniref:DinB family protein n=1 Tax=Umezawaea sp. Da 62-37 TaxID=3075927 RepID=UPI0028F70C5A|nr:DinB family protein [Umezawaea sp. Da 62-37]WNV90472.1 DinB family protein [Umezawaea sp. Da 62-37]